MKITAVICEYNPFTNGHLLHLKAAREQTGADFVVCIMGGSFLQRGNPAFIDKYERAYTAVKNGADAVIELPEIYACAVADNFAFGGVRLANAIGANTLSFGSETGDTKKILEAAQILEDEPPLFKEILRAELDAGETFISARVKAFGAVSDNAVTQLLEKPNDILAVAYARQIIRGGYPIEIHAFKRETSAHGDNSVENAAPSASAIRKLFEEKGHSAIEGLVPEDTYISLLKQKTIDWERFETLLLYRLKTLNNTQLKDLPEVSEGLENRIFYSAHTSTNWAEFLESVKTKKYTEARIRRIATSAFIGIKKSVYESTNAAPPYISVLAIRKSVKDTLLKHFSPLNQFVLTRVLDFENPPKEIRPSVKIDYSAQGYLSLVLKTSEFDKRTKIVE
jgi:predicted nucleotidyltransferase